MPTTVELAEIAAIAGAYHGAPFDVLGQHVVAVAGGPAVAIRTFQPQAAGVSVRRGEALYPMEPVEAEPGFFEVAFPGETELSPYQLLISLPDGTSYVQEDPYRFGPVLSEFDLYLFAEGKH